MQISVKSDINRLTKNLTDIQRNQIPFATSVALNKTVKSTQQEAQRQMVRRLDRPTPFTVRGVAITRSSKRRLVASVFIKPIQAEYLSLSIDGGFKRSTTAQPVEIRLNKYGNIPSMKQGKKIQTLLAKPKVFGAVIGGVNGVWQRNKRGLKLLVKFTADQKYVKRYPFEEIAEKEIGKRFDPFMRQSLNRALATAK